MRERWYVVTRWAGKPEPVTVVKETEKTISIETEYFGKMKVFRRDKSSGSEAFYRTWAEARQAIINREQRNETSARINLESAIARAEKARSLPVEEPEA